MEVLIPNEQTTLNLDKIRIKKPNKTHSHVLMGEAIIQREFNNDIEILCLTYKKAGNDYKLLPYKIGPKKFCDFIEEEKMLYPEFQATTDLPPLGVCPWPPATYHLYGFHPDLSKIPPFLESSDYMVECQFKEGEEVKNAVKVYASLINMGTVG